MIALHVGDHAVELVNHVPQLVVRLEFSGEFVEEGEDGDALLEHCLPLVDPVQLSLVLLQQQVISIHEHVVLRVFLHSRIPLYNLNLLPDLLQPPQNNLPLLIDPLDHSPLQLIELRQFAVDGLHQSQLDYHHLHVVLEDGVFVLDVVCLEDIEVSVAELVVGYGVIEEVLAAEVEPFPHADQLPLICGYFCDLVLLLLELPHHLCDLLLYLFLYDLAQFVLLLEYGRLQGSFQGRGVDLQESTVEYETVGDFVQILCYILELADVFVSACLCKLLPVELDAL